MAELVATICHLTDLHLFVDEDGRSRPPADALRSARLLIASADRVPVPRARDFLSGAMWHREEKLNALHDALGDLLQGSSYEGDAPLIVVQGGDVEALGSGAPSGVKGYDAFPSWSFLHKVLRPLGGVWLDIYGNHDTWPGTYPPMRWRHRAVNRKRIASIPGLGGPWPDVTVVENEAVGIPIVLARLNTVSRTLLTETLASGRVSDHPPAGTSIEGVLDALANAFDPWRTQPAIRIVVMHHPPHVSGAGGKRLTTGWLEGSDELAQRLVDLRVQLVLAGHTHKLDPPRGAIDATPGEQSPLEWPTAQLVAESPTQDFVDRKRGGAAYRELHREQARRSFSVYRLLADGGSFEVERTVFGYSDSRMSFAPARSERVFNELSLV